MSRDQAPPRSTPSPALPTVAIVIPAYRVALHIERVIRGLPSWVRFIIVVDDASPDHVAEIVERTRASDERLELIRHPKNQGVGGAVVSGYRRALALGAEVVVKMDGDGQMDPRYLRRLIAPIVRGDADYTKGNRFHHTGQLRKMPRARLVGNAGLGFLVRLSSGYWNLYDPTNGYTAIHRRALSCLPLDHLAKDYFFESSMLGELGLLGACVTDVPIPALYGDEASSLHIVRVLFRFPPLLFKGFVKRLWLRHLMASFTVFGLYVSVGTVLTLAGAAFGIWHWSRSAITGVPATAGTVMVGALPVALGVLLWIQAIAVDVASVPRSPIARLPEPEDLDPAPD